MDIKEAGHNDLEQLLELYTHLHNNPKPPVNTEISGIWEGIIGDKNHHIIAGFDEGKIISSCVLIIVPNLTHSQRPYGLIENVITHSKYRGKGYGTAILNFAGDIAYRENCYKLMLMTGSKEEGTLCFYEKAGYNRTDKTGFVKWL